MERELSVLVIEDDPIACKSFEDYVETMNDLSIVACTNDSGKGLMLVKEYIPDVVILDLELNEGKGSGVEFLDGIKSLELNYKPLIIVTTNVSSKMMHEHVRSIGADFIMYKHKSDYSEKEVLNLILSMKDSIQRSYKETDTNYDNTESAEKREKHLKNLIYRELDYVGISPKMLGYDYLADAIYLVINNQKENMLRVIGEKNSKSDSSVERAMQNAINKAWRSTDIDELLEHYTAVISSEKGVPTLMEFVYYYAKKLKG